MEITIKGTAKEVADLVAEIQGRQTAKVSFRIGDKIYPDDYDTLDKKADAKVVVLAD